MSYQVLARKYRPQRFVDVVGQEHVTQTLANAIQQNRIAHAYLFVGPRGTGKTTIARIFAKCLNCTDGPKSEFPENDARCQEISDGRSLDVLEIDGASNRGIEEIRTLRETVKYAPAHSRFRIYIIDEVHMLTKEAFNALLKTLEEPPAHAKFMFATTEPEKILPTILSRCQRFDLRRIPIPLIRQHLAHLAQLEHIEVDAAALHAIARGAEGCMRDAESTLDQLISFCGTRIVETDVLSMFGLVARGQIHALAHAILAGEAVTALRALGELARNGKDLSRLLSDLLNHFRNLLLFQISRGDLSLLEVSEDEAGVLQAQAAGLTTDTLSRILEVLSDCEGKLREAISKKILIEVGLMKAIQARNTPSLETVLKQLQRLREEAGSVPASAFTPSPAQVRETPSPASASSPAPKTANVSAANPSMPSTSSPTSAAASVAAMAPTSDLAALWNGVTEGVGRISPFVKSYLLQTQPVSLEKNLLTVGFDPEFADHVELLDNARNRNLIQARLQELGQPGIQIKFVKLAGAVTARPATIAENPAPPALAPTAAPTPRSTEVPRATAVKNGPAKCATPEARPEKPAPASTPVDLETFKNDPQIKQALELFKGQIVDVRV